MSLPPRPRTQNIWFNLSQLILTQREATQPSYPSMFNNWLVVAGFLAPDGMIEALIEEKKLDMTNPSQLLEHISPQSSEAQPPSEAYGKLFLRFLRFGFLAWGGPVAQIAMIRKELVDEEHWISNERFNRTLAIYQILPGPEATELCVYFGMRSRGRFGGVLAGLGFILPGFILMFALSWFYLTYSVNLPLFQAVFLGFQAAVIALIVRAVHRIGGHALHDSWLFGVAIVALIA